MLVVLHGLGDRPENFIRIFESLAGPVRIVAVEALAPWGNGFTWFPSMLTQKQTTQSVNLDFQEAGQKLALTLRYLTQEYPTAPAPVVTGFSQGGAMCFLMATHFPESISAAFPLSGFLPPDWVPTKSSGNAPTLIAFHGVDDTRVSFEKANTVVQQLSSLGYSATMRSYPGVGHSISKAEKRDWLNLLQQALQKKP
jgi:phospholipase/carboxylesterase